MKTLLELKQELLELQDRFGDKYFIFIGPFELKKAQELELFDYYVYNKIQPDPDMCIGISNLDIYFIEKSKINGMSRGSILPFSRLSTTNLSML